MKIKKILATVLATTMVAGSLATSVVYADSIPIVTIGADLTDEQRDLIFNFFGVKESNVEVIEVNNTQEREYLEGLIPDEVIGTRTLSCSYMMPTTSGGIMVKTANLNWVSDGMLANALLTSGIENCQVLATAPFEVSGTGALTGVMIAYEKSSGEELDEDKKELATEELIITGQIIDEVVSDSTETDSSEDDNTEETSITEEQILTLMNDIKAEVINGSLTEDKVKEIVDKNLEEYKIAVTEDVYNKLVAYLTSLSKVDYASSIKKNLTDLSDRITGGFDINVNLNIDFKTDRGSLNQFWTNVFNWLKYIFGGFADDISTAAGSIFDTVDTNIIQYDDAVEESESSEENTSEELENSEDEESESSEENVSEEGAENE